MKNKNWFLTIRWSPKWPSSWISSFCLCILSCCSWVQWIPISNSIWAESGLKRSLDREISLLLILFIDVRIRTRRNHFWTSSVMVEQLHQKILELKYVKMERDRCPDRRSSNIQMMKLKGKFLHLLSTLFNWNLPKLTTEFNDYM